VIASVVAVTLGLTPLYRVLVVERETAASADAAALAAADVAVGIVPGVPCELAASVAGANDTRLDACELEGVIVTVRVSASVLGFTVPATATAGPPGALDY
jgi:hypothetical protein